MQLKIPIDFLFLDLCWNLKRHREGVYLTQYSDLAVNQVFSILHSMFYVMSWDSKMGFSHLKVSFFKNFHFISQFFGLFFFCLFRWSFQFYTFKIQHLTSVSRLMFLPSIIFPVRCHVDLQTIIVYQRGVTQKITSVKAEKSQLQIIIGK